jgi:hypothetical protein
VAGDVSKRLWWYVTIEACSHQHTFTASRWLQRVARVTFDQVHRSIKQDNAIDFRKALDAGLNSNLTNRFGWSLLMLVAIQGNLSIRQELVTRGTKIECATGACRTRDKAASAHRVKSPSCQPYAAQHAMDAPVMRAYRNDNTGASQSAAPRLSSSKASVGILSVKHVSPSREPTSRDPPCARAISAAMNSPSPRPSWLARTSPRKKG